MTIIFNPSSGLTGAREPQERALEVLRGGGVEPRVVYISEQTGAGDLAREALERGDGVVVAGGGDGTVSAAASVLAGSDAALGVLPFGTLNHFAKDLGIPTEAEGAARVLLEGRTALVDAAEVNGRIFVNNSSLGLYAALVAQRTAQQRRGSGKWPAFARACFSVLRRFPFLRVRLEAEGREIVRTTPFVFVGNNEYEVEGFDLGTRPRLDGGWLWLYAAPDRASRFDLLRFAVRALTGRLRQERDFAPVRVRELRIETRRRRLTVALDGEIASMETPLHYRIRPRALRVIVPA